RPLGRKKCQKKWLFILRPLAAEPLIQAGETTQCWSLIGAVPTGWKAPSLQATATTLAIEELTLAYEGLKINNSGGGGAIELQDGRDTLGYFSGSSSSNGLLDAINPLKL
ncbi:MAG: phage tail protein, partial [Phormidesmis sp. CAN_BIN44]|nr:phage tail protein [Phormidesmis sp. CAN_BIN44]